MTRFVLVPGAGGAAWYWNRVSPLLAALGHQVKPVDLPGDDENAGLAQYVDLICAAADDEGDTVLVAQSLGGFTVPLVLQRTSIRAVVFVNAMIPAPGERAGDWWANTDADAARIAEAKRRDYPAEFDLQTYFLHDVPPHVAAEGERYQREETDAVFASSCEFTSWPHMPLRVVVGADDRFFPAGFQRRVARERLDVEVDVLPGGHLMALSQPESLAGFLRVV